jgi:hypothetical protein
MININKYKFREKIPWFLKERGAVTLMKAV